MFLKNLKNSGGQVAVFLALIFPFLILLVALFINAGVLIHQKIRLQTAVDAGVYSGSASLARDLNQIAHLNNNIQQLYNGSPDSDEWEVNWDMSLIDQIEGKSFNDKQEAINIFDQYQARYNILKNMIDSINATAVPKALSIAQKASLLTYYNGNEAMAESNPNKFIFNGLTDFPGGAMINYQETTTTESSSYMNIEAAGGNPFDPYEGYVEDGIVRTINLPIIKNSHVTFAAMTKASTGFENIWFNLFHLDNQEYLGKQIVLKTFAAAQPYGGSVAGLSDTYRATLIPLEGQIDEGIYPNGFWH